MDTMLTYNTNSKTGPVCGGRAIASNKYILRIKEDGFFNIRIKECEENYTN